MGEVRHPGQVVGDVEEAGLGTDHHDDRGDVEDEHEDHDGEVEEAQPGGPVAPAEGQLPVELVGKHSAELTQQEERPEIFEESSLLQVEVLAGPLTVQPGVGDLGSRQVHQIAVPPGIPIEGAPHSVPH